VSIDALDRRAAVSGWGSQEGDNARLVLCDHRLRDRTETTTGDFSPAWCQ
jgi:hypothetical protein